MEKLPKISIVIPSFNKVKYVRETLQSIVDQNYPNLEVIIQDGGSTDGTWEIIKEYIRKYPKIFRGESKKDKGQLDAINKGMKKTTGDILAFINADDKYSNGVFIEVGKCFVKDQNIPWVVGCGSIINIEGKKIMPAITIYKNILLSLNSFFLLLIVNYIVQPSVFLNSKTYKKFGPFTGPNDVVMEYELWLKIGKYRMPKVLYRNLSYFRLTLDNLSSTRYEEILNQDRCIAEKYSDGFLIIQLHKFNNLVRKLILKTSKLLNF